jgi:hypothetical protein
LAYGGALQAWGDGDFYPSARPKVVEVAQVHRDAKHLLQAKGDESEMDAVAPRGYRLPSLVFHGDDPTGNFLHEVGVAVNSVAFRPNREFSPAPRFPFRAGGAMDAAVEEGTLHGELVGLKLTCGV